MDERIEALEKRIAALEVKIDEEQRRPIVMDAQQVTDAVVGRIRGTARRTGNSPNPAEPKRESTTRTPEDAAIRQLTDAVIEILQKDELTRADISKATNLMMAASQVSLAQQTTERTKLE